MTTPDSNVHPDSHLHAEDAPVALAMDWGGTWARAAVIDRQGTILWQDRVANEPGALQDQLVNAAGGLLQAGRDWAEARAIAGAGIAPVSYTHLTLPTKRIV